MADELDVFAQPQKAQRPPQNAPAANPAVQQNGKKQFHKPHQHQRREKVNNSPIRGANGSESVNPLLNAPLPQQSQRVQ